MKVVKVGKQRNEVSCGVGACREVAQFQGAEGVRDRLETLLQGGPAESTYSEGFDPQPLNRG